jgi:hypothetical protein
VWQPESCPRAGAWIGESTQNSPIAQIVLQDCTVNASSNIRLMKSDECDGDSILVDGQERSMMTLISASTESFQ